MSTAKTFLRFAGSNLGGYLDKALLMIKEGTFGICQSCNDLINKERLEEVPHTTKCFDCKTNR